MTRLKKEVEKVKVLEDRLRELEEWQLRLERQRDDDTGLTSLSFYAFVSL